jgi:hypothetical protein
MELARHDKEPHEQKWARILRPKAAGLASQLGLKEIGVYGTVGSSIR